MSLDGYLGNLVIKLMADASQIENLPLTLSRVSQKFRTFGYLASTSLTLPIIAAGRASFNAAKDFEYAMKKIQGLTGALKEDSAAWTKQILAMAPQVGRGPKELAEALYYIASRAYSGAKGMDVLKVSAEAAAAGLGETKDIATLLIASLSAYAKTDLTATKAADIFVAAIREGRVEAKDFVGAIGQVIPIASEMGVTLADLAGGMAAITLTGSTASQAATYIKGVFNSLAKETKTGSTALMEMDDALTGMGSSYKELRFILENEGLVALLEKVRNLTGGDVAKISKIFPNIRGMTGILSMAGKNWEYNKVGIDNVTKSFGSLKRAVESTAQTIQQRYNRAMAQMQVSLITLGNTVAAVFLPFLNKLMDALTRITQHFDSLTETQKRTRINMLALAAALGPLSLVIATIGYSISGIAAGFTAISGAAVYLIALVGGPEIMAGILAMVLVGDVIYKLIKKYTELSDVEKLQRATKKELTATLGDEAAGLELLTKALLDNKLPASVRAQLMQQYNDKYSSLLGYMITEENYLTKLSSAYDTLNPKIQEKINLDSKQNYGLSLSKMVEADTKAKLEAETNLVKWNFEAEKLRKRYQAAPEGKEKRALRSDWYLVQTQHRNDAVKEFAAAQKKLAESEKALADWKKANPGADPKPADIVPVIAAKKKMYVSEIGYLQQLKAELKDLKAQRDAAKTEDEAKAFDPQIAEIESKITEATEKYLTTLMNANETAKNLEEAKVKGMILSAEDEGSRLYNIKIKYLNKEIDAYRTVGKSTLKLESELALAIAEQRAIVTKDALDYITKEASKAYKIREQNALAELDMIVGNEEEVAIRREAIQIRSAQDELNNRKWLLGEDTAEEQNALDIRKKKNEQAYIDEMDAKRRAYAEFMATYKGMLTDIALRKKKGQITKLQADEERKAAMISTYDFTQYTGEKNLAFMESLTKRELQDYIDFLLTKEELAKTSAEKSATAEEILRAQAVLRTKQAADRLKSIGEAANQVLQSSLQGAAMALGEGLGNAMLGLEDPFQAMKTLVAQFLIDMGKALIATALLTEAFKNLIKTPGGAIAAVVVGIAAIAAGTYLKGQLEKGPFANAKPMKNGGLLYGPTNVVAGEYSGARSNPEVFAPLDKLKGMLHPTGGSERLITEISARKLRILLVREEQYQNRGKR